MNIEQRKEAVAKAMEYRYRGGNKADGFFHWKENTSQEIQNIFLDNYEIHDLDYEIFSKACDIIGELSLDELKDEDKASELIQEQEPASVYTADRLAYLNIWNEDEISDMMKEYSISSIAMACAIWYDEQVQSACHLLRAYIIGEDNTR